jgi:hypothetical protein
VHTIFKCQRKKEKGKERVRENPFCFWMSHSGQGKGGEKISDQIKEMQIFFFFFFLVFLARPLFCSLSSPGSHWNVKYSSLQLKGGPWWEQTALLTCKTKLFPPGPTICFSLSSL